jgi:hypothetical protein
VAELKEKACTSCLKVRPRSDFYDNGRPNGRSHCKDCTNAERAVVRRRQQVEKTPLNAEAEKERKRLRYRRRREIQKLKAGKFIGDGPCWCCRSQATGETPYRLCVICGG